MFLFSVLHTASSQTDILLGSVFFEIRSLGYPGFSVILRLILVCTVFDFRFCQLMRKDKRDVRKIPTSLAAPSR